MPVIARTSRLLLLPAAVVGLIAAACGDDDDGASLVSVAPLATDASASVAPATVQGDITVFAATSLTEAFTKAGEAFAAANPDAAVTFSFDASSSLVRQIIEGAPADVFASADTSNMDKLTDAGLNGTAPVVFTSNVLTIIVAPGNPLRITGVAALADPDLKVVVCAPEVPCGDYANQIFTAAGVTVTPVSLEQNVRGVVTKVTAGEADAGIVYVTDVIAAGDSAEMVEIPEDINVVAEYPIATVAASQHAEVDAAFIGFLIGSEGQAILTEHGFGSP